MKQEEEHHCKSNARLLLSHAAARLGVRWWDMYYVERSLKRPLPEFVASLPLECSLATADDQKEILRKRVHSFVDPGMTVYLFLILFIGTFILLSLGAIVYRWKSLTDETAVEENLLSREFALFTAAVVLIASAIIVLVGTSAPLFGQSVDTFFYNEMNIPIAIIIGFLNGLSLLIKWKHTNKQDVFRKSIPL